MRFPRTELGGQAWQQIPLTPNLADPAYSPACLLSFLACFLPSFFKTGPHCVEMTGLELAVCPRLASNSIVLLSLSPTLILILFTNMYGIFEKLGKCSSETSYFNNNPIKLKLAFYNFLVNNQRQGLSRMSAKVWPTT